MAPEIHAQTRTYYTLSYRRAGEDQWWLADGSYATEELLRAERDRRAARYPGAEFQPYRVTEEPICL